MAARAALKPPRLLKERPRGGRNGGALRPPIGDRCLELRPPAASPKRPPAAMTPREAFGGAKVDQNSPYSSPLALSCLDTLSGLGRPEAEPNPATVRLLSESDSDRTTTC